MNKSEKNGETMLETLPTSEKSLKQIEKEKIALKSLK